MAFIHVATTLAVVSAFLFGSAMAKDIVVGDGNGWKLNFDYQEWAKGKQFFVGDNLVFNYPQGVHNVYKVDGNGFKTCAVPDGSNALKSGKDVVTLASAGNKWYICGVGTHCEDGMKLVINVQQKDGSSYSSSAPGIIPRYFAWILASFLLFLLFLMVVV